MKAILPEIEFRNFAARMGTPSTSFSLAGFGIEPRLGS
jgi:hypothetical protein